MILPIQGPLPSQQEIINLIVEKPPAIVQIAPELTVEEKIKQNFYKCNTDTHYIRADNATCLAKPITTRQPARKAATEPIRGSTAGNTYSYGYCTYWVKVWRPDIPNDLGNANTWHTRYSGAKGDTPQVGAVGVAKGYTHVVLVTGVSGSTVTVREANYKGWNVVSTRTAHASEFLYLY